MKKIAKKMLPYFFILPSLSITLVFVLYPILNSFVRSFLHPKTHSFTLENYVYYFTDPIMLKNIGYTLFIAISTSVLTILVAYPFAIYSRFNKSKISQTLYNLILIPRFIPGMVVVYSIKQFISDSGLINRIAMAFGHNLQLGLMNTHKGIIFTNLWFNIPFSVLIIGSALSSVKISNIESARDVGASQLTIFKHIIFPLSFKDALISFTFVFMSNVGAFTSPYLMGGNSPKMLGVVLNDQFSTYRQYESAAALSCLMFFICSISAGIYIYTNMKKSKWELQG